MASIREVAQEAGVGVGTVSRALNGSGYVSPETRKKIEKAAKKLKYTPNELARNLYHNRTGIVGVIVPDLDHPFFSSLVKHIEMELYGQSYKTMICNTVGISRREHLCRRRYGKLRCLVLQQRHAGCGRNFRAGEKRGCVNLEQILRCGKKLTKDGVVGTNIIMDKGEGISYVLEQFWISYGTDFVNEERSSADGYLKTAPKS